MIKIALFCLSLSFTSLFAGVEYDVVLLAPEGEEFTTEISWWDETVKINEAGYVFGNYFAKDNWEDITSYVFHQKIGFKKVNPPNMETFENEFEGVKSVNNQGIAVGIYGGNIPDNYYHSFYRHPSVFVFDTIAEKCYDLLEAFNTKYASGFSLGNRYVDQLYITDDNQVIFNSGDLAYIYDLNQQTVSLLKNGMIRSVNAKGQMIGKSWFLDPKTGEHKLGSLDQFNRWNVSSWALSQKGFVAGVGRDSHGDEKGFVWSLDTGLESFDCGNEPYVLGVNDHGQVIGKFELELDDQYSFFGFVYSREHGLLTLETLGGGVSSPFAINNHSQVVGMSEMRKYDQEAAFLWDLEHGMRNINTLIPENIGWKHLDIATGINDSGCIVGSGKYYGVNHHFLLIPKKSSK